MKAQYLPDRVTTLEPAEAIEALREAFRRVSGAEPSAETLACIAAVSAHETARWGKVKPGFHRYNFGNLKASTSHDGFFTTFRLNEVINGRIIWFDPTTDGWQENPGHPQTRMRAYQTAADGAEDWLRWMMTRRARIWAALLLGSIDAVVRAMKASGYFTASEQSYLNAARWFFGHYLQLCRETLARPQVPEEPEPERSLLSDEDIELLHVEPDWGAVRDERDEQVRDG